MMGKRKRSENQTVYDYYSLSLMHCADQHKDTHNDISYSDDLDELPQFDAGTSLTRAK